MGRINSLLVAAGVALLSPVVASAQEFAYILENSQDVMVLRCDVGPVDPCLSRMLLVDLQDGQVIGNATLGHRSFGSLVRSVDGRTLLWPTWGTFPADTVVAFDRVTNNPGGAFPAASGLRSWGPALAAASNTNTFFRLLFDGLDVFDLDLRRLRVSVDLRDDMDRGLRYLAVTADGTTAFVTTPTGLTVVDVTGARILSRIALPGDTAGAVGLTPDGTALFAIRRTTRSVPEQASLYRINPSSGAVTATRQLDRAGALVVSADGLSVWVADGDITNPVLTGVVRRFRADTLEIMTQVATGRQIHSMTLSANGSKLLVISHDALDVINTATSVVSQAIALPQGAWRGGVVLPPTAPCVFRLPTPRVDAAFSGGSSSVNVPAPSGCFWNAKTAAPWIQNIAPDYASGAGAATFSVPHNAQTTARTGVVWIAGQDLTVVQAAEIVAPGTPGAPTSFDARLLPGGGVTFSWVAPSSGPAPTAYVLEGGTVTGSRDFIDINVGLRTSVSGCCVPNATRYFRVRAQNAAGHGPASEGIAINPALPLARPTNIAVSWTTPFEGVLSWSEPVYSATAFRLELRWALTTVGTYQLTGHRVALPRALLTRSDYQVVISGVDSAGNPGPSSSFDLIMSCQPPPAPTMDATVSGRVVSIALAANFPVPFDAFRIYAGSAPGLSDVAVFDVTTTAVSVPAPPGRYYLRATAVNSCSQSRTSIEQMVVVP